MLDNLPYVNHAASAVAALLLQPLSPFLFRNELVATDRLEGIRAAPGDEIKRMGDEPAVIKLAADDAVIQIAVHRNDRNLALGPYRDHEAQDGAGGQVSGGSDRPWPAQPEAPVPSARPAAAGSE